MVASCKGCDDPPSTARTDSGKTGADDAGVHATVSLEAGAASRDAEVAVVADASADAAVVADEPFGDAGTSTCRLVYGPAEQPFRGPAAMMIVGQELRLVAND